MALKELRLSAVRGHVIKPLDQAEGHYALARPARKGVRAICVWGGKGTNTSLDGSRFGPQEPLAINQNDRRDHSSSIGTSSMITGLGTKSFIAPVPASTAAPINPPTSTLPAIAVPPALETWCVTLTSTVS